MKKKQLFDTRRKVPFSPIVDKDAICDSDGNPLDALYATKKEVAAKQDTLKAGDGISIEGGVISSTFITPITYAELVALRNSSSLVAGMQYRITDYDFTTKETDTASAHQLFDIIVTADSKSVLNESARAAHHQNSLSSRDIAAWELKYTLENIKHSSSNGKGTILWMKDEFRNECNYDFINALFRVYGITACTKSPSLVGTYAIKTINSDITYGTNSKFVSSFGNNNRDNVIKYDGLAKIVFGNNCYSNTLGSRCESNTFGNNCKSNTFGVYCESNTLGNNCYSNIFGNNCRSNTFGNGCEYIKFTSPTSDRTKYNYYRHNHFGDGCQYILFKGEETASQTAQVQNYNFAQGLQGDSSAYLTIDGVRSRAYETKVAKNSAGELKIYCEADLIQ